MPRPNREPEYRRRLREKASHDKDAAETKERETTNENRIEKLTSAIIRVEQQLARTNNEDDSRNKHERLLRNHRCVALRPSRALLFCVIAASP
jgi:hypothetical protein